jgi:hypothetical protein
MLNRLFKNVNVHKYIQHCNNKYLRIPKEVGLGVSLICKIHTQLKV